MQNGTTPKTPTYLYFATIYIFNYLFVHNVVDDSITTFCQTDNEG